MKKWQLIVVAIVIAAGAFTIFQQHETIRQYRQIANDSRVFDEK